MKVFGLAGWSGSGKTSLMVRLIPVLTARGVSLSTMKHAHHTFEMDREGKDSFEHRMAGATEVLITSRRRWALLHELRERPEPTMAEMISRMTPVDLLLIEGFKREEHDKIEVHRPAVGKPTLYPDDERIVAVACDEALPDCPLPVLDLNDAGAVADFVIAHCGLRPSGA